MSRKERREESRAVTPLQTVEQPTVEHEQQSELPAAPEPMPSPLLLPDALNRVRALLWRAAIELGQGHPARKHIEKLGDIPTLPCTHNPYGDNLAHWIATLRLMHAPDTVLRPLTEAAAILGGE